MTPEHLPREDSPATLDEVVRLLPAILQKTDAALFLPIPQHTEYCWGQVPRQAWKEIIAEQTLLSRKDRDPVFRKNIRHGDLSTSCLSVSIIEGLKKFDTYHLLDNKHSVYKPSVLVTPSQNIWGRKYFDLWGTTIKSVTYLAYIHGHLNGEGGIITLPVLDPQQKNPAQTYPQPETLHRGKH